MVTQSPIATTYLELGHGDSTGLVAVHTLLQHLAAGIKIVQVFDDLAKELEDGQGLLLESLVGPQLSTDTGFGELGEELDVSGVGQKVPGGRRGQNRR